MKLSGIVLLDSSDDNAHSRTSVKLYEFDGISQELDLLPLAARRALDLSGRRVGRDGFRSLTREQRVALVEAGEAETVDTEGVHQILENAQPRPTIEQPMPEPDRASVPQEVLHALGAERPLPDKVWQSLSALDRYALVKVCARGRAERIEAAYREIVGSSSVSTHLRPAGGVHMVRVSTKEPTVRQATAESWITLSPQAFAQLTKTSAPKGDVLGTARLAGIMATKRTSDLIPLCHPLALSHVEIDFQEKPETHQLCIRCTAEVTGPTGVEMEALVGASTAALTVYDMLKSIDRGMVIGPTQLIEKSGGRSGHFLRKDNP